MRFKIYICITFILIQLVLVQCKRGRYNETKQSAKFNNPDNIRDRKKYLIKPDLNLSWLVDTGRTDRPWSKSFMDYCAPYHCNAYHKTACGVNRQNLRFKWFQSVCHIILNNKCAAYRGQLKYDVVDNKYCIAYVMFLRTNCEPCLSTVDSPICAISLNDYHTVLFKNHCAMKTANCQPATLDEYKEVDMEVCTIYQGIQDYI